MLVFVSSSVSAFCLGLLSINLATGELPFGLSPLMAHEKKEFEENSEGKEAKNIVTQQVVVNAEEYALSLFSQLKLAKAEVAEEKMALSEQKRLVEALAENAAKLQGELKKSEKKIRRLLIEIDETEIDNVKRLAILISGLDSIAGVEMLLELHEQLASRIVFYMTHEKKTEVLAAMMKDTDPKKKQRAVVITETLQKLTEVIDI